MRRTLAAAAALTLAWGSFGWADKPAVKEGKKHPPNRLAHENSPYLLQHAHNPVNWYPWGPEAFAKARREKKLVFLSIGYSSCYWCHVMERQSFANEEVARLLNEWFVCIKVDREERPDIDTIYMTALNVMGQRGGWPLSMFLTPDGKPVLGGTYWPPNDSKDEDGKVYRGFKTILRLMHEAYIDQTQEIRTHANEMAENTAEALVRAVRGISLVDLDRPLVASAVDTLKEEFDPKYGGFGLKATNFKGTKFPTPPYLELLLSEAVRSKSAELTKMVTVTLDHMAQGGIYDQLGGGFHRYSTERTWTVPHFEKMLYDNAQLVEIYARAYQLTKKPEYQRVIRETLAFIAREMTSPEGGFYSALDAETDGEEGRYYVWTAQVLDAVLGQDKAEASQFKRVYGADGPPNFESKYFIFVLPKPLSEAAADAKLTEAEQEARLAPLRRQLLEARGKRPRPFLDTKVLTAWNGQMIAGYAVAGKVLNEPRYTETAARAADFLLKKLRTPEGRLLRTYGARPGQPAEARLNAYLDDYTYLVHGLLCLHDATGQKKWLDEARTLTDLMVKFYSDKDGRGFFYTSNDHEKLFARAKAQYDGAQPSGNSVAARNLVRLWVKTGDDRYRDLAEKTLKTFAATLKTNPSSLTAMGDALGHYLDARDARLKKEAPKKEAAPGKEGAKGVAPALEVTAVAGKPDAQDRQTVLVTLKIAPRSYVFAHDPGNAAFVGAGTALRVTGPVSPREVKIEYPPGQMVKDELVGDYRTYEGQVTIKAMVCRAPGDKGPLEMELYYRGVERGYK